MPTQARGIKKYEPLWGQWYIEELIGKGSYGEVYKIYRDIDGKREYAAAKYISIPKADDRKNYRRYTQKELTTLFADRADKFSIEISSMLKLKDSKNVVHYEEHIKTQKEDEIGWDIIIRMELLTSLEDYLDEHTFSKGDVVRLGIDICSAIASCQEHDITHRDIKIENIFIDATGNYKLGDFGVSREGKGTATGTITGTEDYMAPEISKEHKYNSTVDIYALGIAMYQLLNNRRNPFIDADSVPTQDDEARAHLQRINGESFPNPKFDNGALARIILKACAFDRHERYASPNEMADELRALLPNILDSEIVLEARGKPVIDEGETEREIFGTDGGSTVREDIDKSGGGTISDTDITLKRKKSKKPILFASIAAALCMVVLVIVLCIPRTIPISDILELPEETTQMVVGDTLALTPKIYPDDATGKLTYDSSDKLIADIDENGIITAVAVGEVTITVKGNDVIKTVTVNIADKKVPVEDITGISETLTLTVGENTQLMCRVLPENATEQTITFESSDSNVATIGSDGVITAVSTGQITITASADGITKNMALTVRAKEVNTPQPTVKSNNNSGNSGRSSGGNSGGNNSSNANNNYTPPKTNPPAQNNPPPVVNNTPAPANNGGGGSSGGGKQYDAGDLNAFQ